MKHEVLQAMLVDVRDMGSARVDRRKLAWMLGRINLNASAFQLLNEEWALVAPSGPQLLAFEWADQFTLQTKMPDLVRSWT